MTWDLESDEPAGTERVNEKRFRPNVTNGKEWRMCRSKSRFKSEHQAQRYADRDGEKHHVKMRFYECSLCHGWHLTTKGEG
jgi:hypothetical protein